MRALTVIIFAFYFFSGNAFSQETTWLVRFTDRPDTTWNPKNDYHPKAIERRGDGGFSRSDFPVCESYIAAVRASGADVKHPLRWFNGVSCKATPAIVSRIEALPFVADVVQLGDMKAEICEFSAEVDVNFEVERQREAHDAVLIDEMNLTGKGVRIAVLDVGFSDLEATAELHHLFENGQIEKTYDFIRNRERLGGRSAHGTVVLSCMAGITKGEPMGFAKDATYLLAVTERSGADITNEEDDWLAGIEWADRNGVDIVNSSLGYTYHRYFQADMNGRTSLVAQAAVMAARKGMLVVVAAGNEGNKSWQFVSTPADADSIIAVGGVDPVRQMRTNFSSYGPTVDGRMKPELVAFGEVMAANGDGMVEMRGTSFSSPLLAGFAAAIWQAFPDDDNMQLRRRLMASGELYPFFNYSLGFGIPKACKIFEPFTADLTFDVIENEEGFEVIIGQGNDAESEEKSELVDLVYCHLVDENGKILHYTTFRPDNEKGGKISYDLIESHAESKILRVHFKGYTYEIDLTKPR
ncbi:MAG: S8 family serine peptidase [Cryomorphaceae bacterium]|nr:S8 family serine peptidase [Cryomorphaceae bacterium]